MKIKDKILQIISEADKLEEEIDNILKQLPRSHIKSVPGSISFKLAILKQALDVEQKLNEEYKK